MRVAVRKVGAESPTHLIEFERFTHDGRVTKIRTGCVRNVRMYVIAEVIAHRWRPWRVPKIALERTALVAGRKQRNNKHDYC